MMLLLAKKKPCSIILLFSAANRTTYHRFCSAAATQNPVPGSSSIFSLNDYLVASWGFSPDKAARLSKRLTHVKSPEKPDSVLRFLNHQGFSNADIQRLVTWYPNLLSSCPQTILEPNIIALRNMGFSSSSLNEIILSSPAALQLNSAVPRIKFWLDFFGGDEVALVKAFRRNTFLINQDIGKRFAPKIYLLESYGFSTHDIRRIVLEIPRFISHSTCTMKKVIEHTKELGFHPDSGMFVHGLEVVSCMSKETLQKKAEILKGFGWSEEEFLSAFRKAPKLGLLSEENLQTTMSFLLGEANCELSYTVRCPVLLLYSLEKRMRPRQHVLHLLKSKGLSGKGKACGFFRAMAISNSKFEEKYIVPNKNEIPELHEIYLAACGCDTSSMLES